VTNLVLCGTALVWYPDDPLCIETCRNIQCDVIKIAKEQCCAFCWLGVANWLSTVRGMNCVNYKPCFDGKAIKRRLFKIVVIIKTLRHMNG